MAECSIILIALLFYTLLPLAQLVWCDENVIDIFIIIMGIIVIHLILL